MKNPADFHILLLNDMHISLPGELYHNRDSASVFRQTLNALCKIEQPDLIILNGDICAIDPSAEIYDFVARHLEESGIPVIAIPGNHDDPAMMMDFFPLPAQVLQDLGAAPVYASPEDPYCGWAKLHNCGISWLNSFDHTLSTLQREWLHANAGRMHAQNGSLVFIHHPPVHVPCIFMESNYPLQDREQAYTAIRNIPDIQRIFCGHYHRRYEHKTEPVTMVSSSLYTMDPEHDQHRILHYNPGYARIYLRRTPSAGIPPVHYPHYTVAELPEKMLKDQYEI
ncbi:MAG: metallophosphoesterase family protein [Spirochaeta sp.]